MLAFTSPQAALGAGVLPRLASLELREVVGLTEEQLAGLAGLTQLSSLSVCAMVSWAGFAVGRARFAAGRDRRGYEHGMGCAKDGSPWLFDASTSRTSTSSRRTTRASAASAWVW
mgnify:CR=1 FL=1